MKLAHDPLKRASYTIDGLKISQYATVHAPQHLPKWYQKRCMREYDRYGRQAFSSEDVERWEKAVENYYKSMDGSNATVTKERIFGIWDGMMKRCYQKNSKDYPTYGGRGIEVCELWRNDYRYFISWSLSSGYNDSLSIDRIDGNKGYSPDNCQWIPIKDNCQKAIEAMRNKRKKQAEEKRKQKLEALNEKKVEQR